MCDTYSLVVNDNLLTSATSARYPETPLFTGPNSPGRLEVQRPQTSANGLNVRRLFVEKYVSGLIIFRQLKQWLKKVCMCPPLTGKNLHTLQTFA